MPDDAATTSDHGRWAKGTSGNPAGRPKGSRNKATVAMESLLDGAAEALINKVLARALEGDLTAIRLCLERILPVKKDRHIELELPPTEDSCKIAAALESVIRAIADGQITPTEGDIVSSILVKKLKAVELQQLESRVLELEQRSRCDAADTLPT